MQKKKKNKALIKIQNPGNQRGGESTFKEVNDDKLERFEENRTLSRNSLIKGFVNLNVELTLEM
jgi:hypothetical protein